MEQFNWTSDEDRILAKHKLCLSIVWKEKREKTIGREKIRSKDRNINYILHYQRIMTTLLCIFLIQSYWKVSFLLHVSCGCCGEWKLKNFHVWGKQFSILDRGILVKQKKKKKTQSAKKGEFLEIKDNDKEVKFQECWKKEKNYCYNGKHNERMLLVFILIYVPLQNCVTLLSM